MRWWPRRRQVGFDPGFVRGRYWPTTVDGGSIKVKRTDAGAVYEVYEVRSEAAALEFLRGRDVRQEQHYVIVETPYRNLGRDMIMIFDESDGAPIEIPERTPLPELRPSPTHCARCGYPVLPVSPIKLTAESTELLREDPDRPYVVEHGESPDEVVLKGMGYRCTSCDSAACAACYQSTGYQAYEASGDPAETAADGSPLKPGWRTWRRCWVCESPVTAYTE